MPIINNAHAQKKTKIKTAINSGIFETINEYCSWADIQDLGFFIEEAASFVFAKDRDWKQHKKNSKKNAELMKTN